MSQSAHERFLRNVNAKKLIFRKFLAVRTMFSVLAIAITATVAIAASDTGTTSHADGAKMYLLTEMQYRQIIKDTFGADIEFTGVFAQEDRADGLLAVSSGQTSISDAQLQSFDAMARKIADQVTAPQHRGILIACQPENPKKADNACATKVIRNVGLRIFRRPLSEQELTLQVAAAGQAAEKVHNFYDGLSISLSSMLMAPEFLFRTETVTGPPGNQTLDDYSRASRLSFFLWDSQPDNELLRAAKDGELHTAQGLVAQVDRMVVSRRFEYGMRSFFSDMLHFDEYSGLEKDAMIYPRFTSNVSAESEEQTLRTLTDLLVTRNGDYRDIFTTRRTFLTPELAAMYNISLPRLTAPMELPSWEAVELPEGDIHAGILAQISFTALHSHPGVSSPTLRGRALREVFMCQKIPNPPAFVNTALPVNPELNTMRLRLTAHRNNPVCASCHKLMDPMGLTLESFDGSGGFRTTENGVPIDTTGDLNGVTFSNALGLEKALHDDPKIPNCLVQRAVTYGMSRQIRSGERAWVAALNQSFADSKYNLPNLFRRIATSPEFFRPDSNTGKVTTAAN